MCRKAADVVSMSLLRVALVCVWVLRACKRKAFAVVARRAMTTAPGSKKKG